MYPLGHLGLALLLIAPIIIFFKPKTATGFSVFVLMVALLPDIDTYIPFLTHHGVTHTVAFSLAAGIIGGVFLAGGAVALRAVSDASIFQQLAPTRILVLGGLAIFCGVLSHVVGDLLLILPGTEPIPLFWPISSKKYEFQVIPLGGPLRNAALFIGGLLIHTLISWRAEQRMKTAQSYADSE